jgi:bifunctional DNA-binding transcriptional regulator/antitoxin component of YhaV-PrlF toxin-antitoxin module
MLAKLTSKNQFTLPKAIVNRFPGIEYFNVEEKDGRIILTPVKPQAAEAVRQKLAELGITEADVLEAVTWARQA